MKKIILIYFGIFSGNLLFSQVYLEFSPNADVSIGFHDGGTSADVNYGDASHFSAFSQPAVTVVGENAGWGLIQFDLTTIPVGSEIISAYLNLIAFGDDFSSFINSGHQGSNACWLSKILEPWEENTVTWNTKPAITDIGEIELPESVDPYQDYMVDVTTLIQDIADAPISNFGFALHLQNESPTQGLMFKSSDDPDEELWPVLTVTYSEPTEITTLIKNATNLKISPNPANDMVEISIQNIANYSYSIELFNALGELVTSFKSSALNPQISVKDLYPGIYNLKVRKMDEIFSNSTKLIIY